ncbi:MAG: cyclic nucleotide-binding domain-containing protein, partial [Rhodospirillaceae bacterium]
RGNPVEPADEPLLKAKFRSFPSAGTVADALARIQENVPLFREMTALQLREFMLDSDVRTPREGDIVFQKDDYTNTFFSIVAGTVLVEAVDSEGAVKQIPLGQGHFFGEMGLLSGRRRTATVRAGSGCVLVETPRRSMLKLIGSIESVRRQIDQAFLRRAVRTHIAQKISEDDLDEIVQGAAIKAYAAGETIFSEGDEPDGLHLIRRGSVMVVRDIGGKEVVLSYVAAGNYIGEMALLSDARRTATVRAAVNTETILLQVDNFNKVVERNVALRDEMQARAFQRVSRNVRRENETDPGNLIGFLLGQGLGEATDVLLIDESLCIRCDNCEKACADSHDGTSRLDREAGPTFANIHVPTTCRHCENPHCMKDCPPDAIHRSPNGEVVIADTCIGCGNCQRNCPYGVVQLAPVDPRRRAPSLWAWLLTGLTPEPGRERRTASKDQMKKAVKCDMCKDLSGGPACVRACPTGAALRVSPEEFLGYATR